MTQRTRTQFSTLQPARHGSSERTCCEVPWVSGSVLLPAPADQQTPWRRGGDAAWCWSLPDTGATDADMLSQRLPVPQHRLSEAHNRLASGAPLASITMSLARDQRRLSAHLDSWMRMLMQHLPGQQGMDEGQPEGQTRRRRHSDSGVGFSDEQAQRPTRPAARTALRGGGGADGGPQPAASRGQQGSDLPVGTAPAGDGVPLRYGAEIAATWSVSPLLSL